MARLFRSAGSASQQPQKALYSGSSYLLPETKRLPSTTYLNNISDALVIPILLVTLTGGAGEPSSAIYRSERLLVRSFALSRSRVIPKAAANRPGPEVSL